MRLICVLLLASCATESAAVVDYRQAVKAAKQNTDTPPPVHDQPQAPARTCDVECRMALEAADEAEREARLRAGRQMVNALTRPGGTYGPYGAPHEHQSAASQCRMNCRAQGSACVAGCSSSGYASCSTRCQGMESACEGGCY